MEWENARRRSSGTAKAGLATGIVGTTLGGLAFLGGGANMLANGFGGWGRNSGWGWNNSWNNGFGGTPQNIVINTTEDFNDRGRSGYGYYGEGGCCSENMLVNRYELSLQQQLAEKDSQIALRDANTYNDQKMLEMYKYIDGELKDIRGELCRQAVINQKTEDSFTLVAKDIDCCCKRLETQICNEARERRCADNQIINYTNATFYPKMVADVTTGTTTTAQTLYNPLPQNEGCCCNCGNN